MNEKELQKLNRERDEFLAGWQRSKADLANYKREEKERARESVRWAKEELFLELFGILDNLERAEASAKKGEKNDMARGFLQIAGQMREFLKSQGIREIESEGKEFDPEAHEAVGETDKGKSGQVLEVVEKGYMLGDKLVRPAKVIVSK